MCLQGAVDIKSCQGNSSQHEDQGGGETSQCWGGRRGLEETAKKHSWKICLCFQKPKICTVYQVVKEGVSPFLRKKLCNFFILTNFPFEYVTKF